MNKLSGVGEKTFGKFLIFCLLICLLILCPEKRAVLLCAVQNEEYAKYYYYCFTKVEDLQNAQVLDNGVGSIVICSIENCQSVKRQIENISGESVSFYADYDYFENSINLLDAKIVFYEQIDNMRLVYAFSSKIGGYVRVNNQKVNLQLVYKNGTVTIGTPIILGSY
jgi:hypothetical protein